MFTGIVEGRGSLVQVGSRGGATRLVIGHPFGAGGIGPGDSVAVNGVCLTAVEPGADRFAAELSPETLARTTIPAWRIGHPLNLERALTPTSRMGGHFVTGHVDGVGELVSDQAAGGAWTMHFAVPAGLIRYLAGKGSVAVDGVSLTVAGVELRGFSVAVIPTTREKTNLGALSPGSRVHLEMDVLAKYVEALLGKRETGLTEEVLARAGFTAP